MLRHITTLVIALAALALLSCGQDTSESFDSAAAPAGPQPFSAESQLGSGFPAAPPADSVRRGDSDSASRRWISSIDADSEFAAGIAREAAFGTVSDSGQASALSSGSAGQRKASFALYRLPLAGQQPGTLAVDVNLKARSGGSGPSQYWVGLSDYSAGRWDWRGPFSDGQIRLSLGAEARAGTNWLSGAGSLYVALAGYDGAQFDVVGVGAKVLDAADTTASAAPAGLTATPVAGGLELQWNELLAADLAGYRVYYSSSAFSSVSDSGVRSLPYLENTTRCLLGGISGLTFVRLAAVDHSGNESALSSQAGDAPLPAAGSGLLLSLDTSSAHIGDPVTLSVSGASAYDVDRDGDGSFELIGDSSGSYSVDTGSTGLIRARVRGSGAGSVVAYGGVSLLVAANFPPVAKLSASPALATLWGGDSSNVDFDASASTDDSAGSLEYAFDKEGDGSFGAFAPGAQVSRSFSVAGSYLASVQVRDSAGLVGYAYALVRLRQAAGFHTTVVSPQTSNVGNLPSCAMIAGCPAIAYASPNSTGMRYARARDPQGYNWSDVVTLSDNNNSNVYNALAEIGGRPAVVYYSLSGGGLLYQRASTSTGASALDWPPAILASGTAAPGDERLAMLEVQGQPAIAWVNSASQSVYYKRAQGSGDLAADWAGSALEVNAQASGNICMLMVAGQPALVWRYGLLQISYERSSTSTGDTVNSWSATPAQASNGVQLLFGLAAAVIDGQPAVVYGADYGSFGNLLYARSSTVNGMADADWANTVVLSSNAYQIVGQSLQDLNGKPALAFGGPYSNIGTELYFMRGADADGSAWTDPQLASSLAFDSGPGQATSMVCSDGWVGIASVNNSAPQRLDFNTLQFQ